MAKEKDICQEVPEGFYKHYKGGAYRVLNVAEHTNTGEKLVIYFSIRNRNEIWARPLSEWNEEVLPGVHRFEPIAATEARRS